MITRIVAKEIEIIEPISYTAMPGHKYTVFMDPITGKYFRPVDGFEVTGTNLEDRFIDLTNEPFLIDIANPT